VGARKRTAVDQNILAGDKARMLAAQKSASLAKLIGMTKALGRREFFTGLGQGFNALTGFGGGSCQRGF
jgi:hypothetical protein